MSNQSEIDKARLAVHFIVRASHAQKKVGLPANVTFHNALEKSPESVKTATSFIPVPGANAPPRKSQADRPFCSHFRFC